MEKAKKGDFIMSGLLQSEIKAPTHSIISKILFLTLLKKKCKLLKRYF